jgi:hypothetical protein
MVPPGSPTETPIPLPEGLAADDERPRLELEEGVGLIEMVTPFTVELLGLIIVGNTTELKVGNWPVLIEVEPCLMPLTAEETGIEPRESELLGFALDLELLTTGLLELFRVGSDGSLKELLDFALDFALDLELLTPGLLELLRVGSGRGSLMEMVVGFPDDELGFFEEEEELSFLLEEGTTGFLLEDEETGFLLEEDDFADDEEIFLLEVTGLRVMGLTVIGLIVTGLTVTVDFLMETGEAEAVLVELVNFKMLERVSFLLEIGLIALETGLTALETGLRMLETGLTMLESGLTVVDAFFEVLLLTFLVLLLAFLVLMDTLIGETLMGETLMGETLMGETLGMDKVVVGLIAGALAVPERPTVTVAPAVTPMPSRGSRLSRRTFSATSPKGSSLLSLAFKGAARMRAGAKRPKMAAWPAIVTELIRRKRLELEKQVVLRTSRELSKRIVRLDPKRLLERMRRWKIGLHTASYMRRA